MLTRILLTGALGQIGTELYEKLVELHGRDNVISLDIKDSENYNGVYVNQDVTDYKKLRTIIEKYEIKEIYHLASLLSATGEERPCVAWKVNTVGLKNVLDISKDLNIKVFWPSSIAVFDLLS